MKRCAYPNTQSAAYALRDWINAGHYFTTQVSARPYNFHVPLYTAWWLFLSTDWPAYHHSKLFFHPKDGCRVLFTGLYVEKGLAPAVSAAFPTGQKLVMKDHWAWHRIFAAIKSGEFEEEIVQVAQQSKLPVRVEVDAGFAQDPGSYDPYASPMVGNRAAFDTTDGELVLVDSTLGGIPFEHVIESQDLAALAGSLEALPSVDWTWINLCLGVRLEMAPLVPNGQSLPADAWDASAIWEKCLQPWKPWIF